MSNSGERRRPPSMERRELAERLGATGWGLFFIWAGVVMMAEMPLGVGFLGAGMITLGGQAARHHFGLRLERFWLMIGVLWVVSGLWEIFAQSLVHVPIILLLFGVMLLLGVFRRRPRHRSGDEDRRRAGAEPATGSPA